MTKAGEGEKQNQQTYEFRIFVTMHLSSVQKSFKYFLDVSLFWILRQSKTFPTKNSLHNGKILSQRLGKNRDATFIAAAMVLCVAHTQRERACERDAQVWVC